MNAGDYVEAMRRETEARARFRRQCEVLGVDADKALAAADDLALHSVLSTEAARTKVLDAAVPIEKRLASLRRPSPRCSYCGRDEGDDIGPVVNGACPGCATAWA